MNSELRVATYQYTAVSNLHTRNHLCQCRLDCWRFTFFLANYQFKQFEYTLVHCNALNLCFNAINALGKLFSEEWIFIFSQKEQLHTRSGLMHQIGVWEIPGFGDRRSGKNITWTQKSMSCCWQEILFSDICWGGGVKAREIQFQYRQCWPDYTKQGLRFRLRWHVVECTSTGSTAHTWTYWYLLVF